ncbi:MAG TPA: hypothetical protein DCP92_25345 [Nitrospiraceae bacterium]|jgi:hypothetical protein|nr:hypothetical protein [Nitrospiraceae bacterium]
MTRITTVLLIGYFLLHASTALGAEIIGPDVQLIDGEVLASTGLLLDEKSLLDLKNGIAKELTFYIDLYRVWNLWPDEFITGKKIIKTLKSDPVRKECVATSFDGTTSIRKRFTDLDSMLTWTLNLKGVQIANTKELEPSKYFVRITAESHLRSFPPVIGYLLFFIPEMEFKITKDSAPFTIGGAR